MTAVRARELRKQQTVQEGRLWQRLRNRQLGGAKFRRQAPIGNYIVDFVCFESRVIVEIDGSVHDLPERAERDAVRHDWLEHQGFRVIRFRDGEVYNDIDSVLRAISEALNLHAV
jgi:5-methyltetrahydrofolate--homocysteine methyltransferase